MLQWLAFFQAPYEHLKAFQGMQISLIIKDFMGALHLDDDDGGSAGFHSA